MIVIFMCFPLSFLCYFTNIYIINIVCDKFPFLGFEGLLAFIIFVTVKMGVIGEILLITVNVPLLFIKKYFKIKKWTYTQKWRGFYGFYILYFVLTEIIIIIIIIFSTSMIKHQ